MLCICYIYVLHIAMVYSPYVFFYTQRKLEREAGEGAQIQQFGTITVHFSKWGEHKKFCRVQTELFTD